MTKRRRLISFFEEYEANFNSAILCDSPGAEACAAAFEGCFVAADPAGVNCGHNGAALVRSIEEGCRFYREIGTHAVRLEGIDSTPIDQHHVMARVHWRAEYRRPGGASVEIPFDVVYFVRMTGDVITIFGYVTGDEKKALRDHGLIP